MEDYYENLFKESLNLNPEMFIITGDHGFDWLSPNENVSIGHDGIVDKKVRQNVCKTRYRDNTSIKVANNFPIPFARRHTCEQGAVVLVRNDIDNSKFNELLPILNKDCVTYSDNVYDFVTSDKLWNRF